METVMPFKTVNDLMKELNEGNPDCQCKPTEGES